MKQINILSQNLQFFYRLDILKRKKKRKEKKPLKKLRIKSINKSFPIVLVNFIHKSVFVPCTLVTIRINPYVTL